MKRKQCIFCQQNVTHGGNNLLKLPIWEFYSLHHNRQDGPPEVKEVQHRDDQAGPGDEEGQEEMYRHFW